MSDPVITPVDASIKSATLEENHILNFVVHDSSGQEALAALDLDTVIGNVNGALSLGGTNFSHDARSVTLSPDGQILDAELPDVNGTFSTSSVAIASTVGDYEGKTSLLMAMGLPHSTVHTDADTVAEADQTIAQQTATVDGDSTVEKTMTLHLHPDYDMSNPNAGTVALIKEGLGPFGNSQANRNAANFAGNVQLGWQIGHSCILM